MVLMTTTVLPPAIGALFEGNSPSEFRGANAFRQSSLGSAVLPFPRTWSNSCHLEDNWGVHYVQPASSPLIGSRRTSSPPTPAYNIVDDEEHIDTEVVAKRCNLFAPREFSHGSVPASPVPASMTGTALGERFRQGSKVKRARPDCGATSCEDQVDDDSATIAYPPVAPFDHLIPYVQTAVPDAPMGIAASMLESTRGDVERATELVRQIMRMTSDKEEPQRLVHLKRKMSVDMEDCTSSQGDPSPNSPNDEKAGTGSCSTSVKSPRTRNIMVSGLSEDCLQQPQAGNRRSALPGRLPMQLPPSVSSESFQDEDSEIESKAKRRMVEKAQCNSSGRVSSRNVTDEKWDESLTDEQSVERTRILTEARKIVADLQGSSTVDEAAKRLTPHLMALERRNIETCRKQESDAVRQQKRVERMLSFAVKSQFDKLRRLKEDKAQMELQSQENDKYVEELENAVRVFKEQNTALRYRLAVMSNAENSSCNCKWDPWGGGGMGPAVF